MQSQACWNELSSAERVVLEAVFWEPGVPRSALALQVQFSKSKLNGAVASLLMSGLLCESGEQRSTGRRKPEGLRVHDGLGVIYFGNVGCVEAVAAGPAIARTARTAAESGESALLSQWLRAGNLTTPLDVARASREANPVANAIIQKSGQLIGQMLAALVNFYNPSHIILTGGITKTGLLWLASIRQSVYQRSLACPHATWKSVAAAVTSVRAS
ncbi:ROK family protein [Deinococcus peraridilitoris]|uniref:Transcriptional regulator/sugar kinase n=1 Tax=Deinococcus peraridilitoris (strain DSM 19664 / LMG 22246 / CIP 109416 / KR-200) TaxID=937777 RepID=L0A5Y1_DEIPD|nr:ROK family protein [Deinococcus peraridilitoris]AFZ68572.1 hypothetical protein Deipe_3126 [Deinococcus peraridilitoris DSM 19664]